MSNPRKVAHVVHPWTSKAATDKEMGANEPQLHESIALLAYQRAQERNCEPGHELEDWLDAEAQILEQAQRLKSFPA